MRSDTKKITKGQETLFDLESVEDWKSEWEGMPEFIQKDVTSYKSVIVHFATEEDMRKFAKLLKQNVTETTRSIWYPEAEIGRIAGRLYVDENTEEEEEE